MENKNIYSINNPFHYLSLPLFRKTERSPFALFSLLFLFLLTYNSAIILCLHFSLEPKGFSPEKAAGDSIELPSPPIKESEENPIPKLIAHLPNLEKPHNSVVFAPRKTRKKKLKLKFMLSEATGSQFSARAKEFFQVNSCKLRFFMTWISSVDLIGERELFTIESLFRFNPNGCLLIVSNSMDSERGMRILSQFSGKGFHVIAISPNFHYLLKHTPAEDWFNWLKMGNVKPGKISLGQNLSNLLRLALLYKFGGVYLDTDFIILKSFSKLRNSIGAQTFDPKTKSWTRLNNAVMIFKKGHPTLYKFIQEFVLTFDGNKWGHNGPYLVSRVVSREIVKDGSEINILKPMAFYPVDWSRIGGFFHGPTNETHSRWMDRKFQKLRNDSYAVHLWNRQTRKLTIQRGSIISRLISDSCVFCNSSI